MDNALVKARLIQLGYAPTDGDDMIINYIGTTVENTVKSIIGISSIPNDAVNIVTDKIVGEFLLNKKNSGQSLGTIDLSAVTQINEGDCSVSFDKASTPSQQLDNLIAWLISGRDAVLLTHRRLSW